MTTLELAGILVSGIAAGISFWPGNYGWLSWLVFVPFFGAVLKKDWKTAFFRGWLFGICAWISGTYWLVSPLSKFLNIPFAAALPLFLAVCCWHALMFALLAGATHILSFYFSRRLGWRSEITLLWTAAPVMAAIECFFPTIFPIHLASTQYFHLPQVQIIELFGPAGMVWLIMGFNAAGYLLVKALWERKFKPMAGGSRCLYSSVAIFGALCGLLLFNECYGLLRIRQIDEAVKEEIARGHSLRVSIIQGAIPVEDAETLAVYRRLTTEVSKAAGPDIIIWPESVYNRTAEYEIIKSSSGERPVFSPDFERDLKAEVPCGTDILMGTEGRLMVKPARDAPKRAIKRNIAFVTGPKKELLGLVEKRYLFPFGEFIPLGSIFPGLYRMFPYANDLSAGNISRPLNFAGAKAGVVICYEDLYTEAARRFVEKGANVLFNITNETRFGYDLAPEQHLNFSALRAIENRRFFIRAANTGISAVVDPTGRIVKRLEVKERGVITAKIPLMDCRTFYSKYGNFLCLFGILLISSLVFWALTKPPGDSRLL